MQKYYAIIEDHSWVDIIDECEDYFESANETCIRAIADSESKAKQLVRRACLLRAKELLEPLKDNPDMCAKDLFSLCKNEAQDGWGYTIKEKDDDCEPVTDSEYIFYFKEFNANELN